MSRFIISGFSDEISPNIDEQIAGVKQLGLSHLVLRFVDGQNIADLTIDKAKEVKSKLDRNGIGVSSLGSPIGKVDIDSPFAEEMKRFLHVLDLAKIFETRFIRIFSFYVPQGKDVNIDQYSATVIDRLGAMAVVAEKHGITLIHENEKGIYGDNDTRCNEILTALAPYGLKAAFDPANFVQCGVDTLAAFRLLKQHVAYMHIKDANASDNSIVPAGEGDGQIREILYDIAYNGDQSDMFLSLEPHLGSFVGLDTLEKDSVVSEKEMSSLSLYSKALAALKKITDNLLYRGV